MASNLVFQYNDTAHQRDYRSVGRNKKNKIDEPKPAGPITFPTDDRYMVYAKAKYSTSAEYKTPVFCEVTGTIPKWVDGSFLRLGPGKFEWGTSKINHYFDGDSLLHCFNITKGTVTYHSQFLESQYHKKNEKYNRVSTMGIGTWAPPDPCANIFRRIVLYFTPNVENDNANVKVVKMDKRAFASTEMPWMIQINPETLEVIKNFNMSRNAGGVSRLWLAHPHYDEEGNYWIFSTNPKQGKYDLIMVPNDGCADPVIGERIMATIKSSEKMPAYFHSFAMTENYFILLENPFYINSILSLITINWYKKALLDILKWMPEKGLIMRVVCRKTFKELRRCKADAAFIFHHVNAFEKDGNIIMDVCAYPDESVVSYLYMKNISNALKGQTYSLPNLYRYRLPIKELQRPTDSIYMIEKYDNGQDYEVLAAYIETPIINYDEVNGKEYEFMYGTTDIFFQTSLMKVNVKTKQVVYWKAPELFSASEPMFIKSPFSKKEDGGVIVSTVTGCDGEKSFLLVLDAVSFQEIARAVMPVPMALMIHGTFLPNDKT